MSSSVTPRDYDFLLVPGFAMMSYACVCEPLRAANVIAGREIYRWRHLSIDGTSILASNGMRIAADGGLACEPAETVLVCAGGNPGAFEDAGTMRWLRAAARKGCRLGGISAGPYILARAGLLDGHRATIHWEHAPAFREAFPRVELTASLYEIDRRRLTSAGGIAALDLMHRIIAQDEGEDLARAVSDWFLQAHVRPGSGGQRLALRERLGVESPRLEQAVAAMQSHLEEPLERQALAALAGISLRQLDRLFAGQLGVSVGAFYLGLRLERAGELLRQTSLSVTEIAVMTGFQSPSSFSRAYRRRFGRAPRER